MQGLRDEAKFAIAKAMEAGRYPKSETERQAEIEEFEDATWKAHGQTYCKAYLAAVNKKCRDMWLTATQLDWLFPQFERLEDIPLTVAAQAMREFVTLQYEAGKHRDDCDRLHESMELTKQFLESRQSVANRWNTATSAVKEFMRLSHPGATEQFPAAEFKKAKDSVAEITTSLNQVVKAWSGWAGKSCHILKKEEFEETLARYNSLRDLLVQMKPRIDAAALACQQLRVVHAQGFSYLEAFAQMTPVTGAMVLPPFLSMPNLLFTNGGPQMEPTTSSPPLATATKVRDRPANSNDETDGGPNKRVAPPRKGK